MQTVAHAHTHFMGDADPLRRPLRSPLAAALTEPTVVSSTGLGLVRTTLPKGCVSGEGPAEWVRSG